MSELQDLDIRIAMLNSSQRQRIKALMLSDGDLKILGWVSSGLCKSGEIATAMRSSTSTISTRLKSLWERGYVARERHLKGTGEQFEYTYKSIYEPNLDEV